MIKWVKRVSGWLLLAVLAAVAWFVGFGLAVTLAVFGIGVPPVTTSDYVVIGVGTFVGTYVGSLLWLRKGAR